MTIKTPKKNAEETVMVGKTNVVSRPKEVADLISQAAGALAKGSETGSCFCVSGEGLDREHLEWRDAP